MLLGMRYIVYSVFAALVLILGLTSSPGYAEKMEAHMRRDVCRSKRP